MTAKIYRFPHLGRELLAAQHKIWLRRKAQGREQKNVRQAIVIPIDELLIAREESRRVRR